MDQQSVRIWNEYNFTVAKWEAIERAFAEATLDPARWNAAMDAASAVTGGRSAEAFARVFGLAAASTAVEVFELAGIAVV